MVIIKHPWDSSYERFVSFYLLNILNYTNNMVAFSRNNFNLVLILNDGLYYYFT